MRYFLKIFIVTILSVANVMYMQCASAGSRFSSSSPCHDSSRRCISSGMRTIDGFKVHKDCWEWQYEKRCNYPSRNNCSSYSHCYSLGQRGCLARDSLGNCVNIKKEFSCKRYTPTHIESRRLRVDLEEKDGIEGPVCQGIPCVDGNCIDKSYTMDDQMLQSVSQLYALSRGKNDGVNFKIFEGLSRHCSKKVAGYSNCCKVHPKGWGKQLGAKCNKDEKLLGEFRQKNLCVYVGRKKNKTAGVTTLAKHYFCCFTNLLEKTIQVQGRRQLGINFGSGSNTTCRGLTFDELQRIDFSLIDFSEVAAEIQQKMVMPNIEDLEGRVHDSLIGANKFDSSHMEAPSNKGSGINDRVAGEMSNEEY